MSSSKKVVTLRSSDGEMFEVEESVAIQSQTIKHMIEDGCADRVIPLLNVSGEVLSKVIVYLKKHVESTASAATDDDSDKSGEESLKAWDAEFVGVEQSTIFNLILVRAERLLLLYSVFSLYSCRSVGFGHSIMQPILFLQLLGADLACHSNGSARLG